MPPVTEIALVVGPMEPQTKRGLSGVEWRAQAARAMRGGQAVELEGLVGEAVLGEHQRRAAEGVGLDDVAAGGEVALVDAVDHVGAGGAEVFVAPLELGAAEVVGGQGDALERGAGGAVEHEDARVEGRQQERGARVHVGGARGGTVRRRPGRSTSLSLPAGKQKSPPRRHHETGFPLRTLNCHREAATASSLVWSERAPWVSVPGCRARPEPDRS